ncbi:MAG: hypothetical protein KatS3mg105_2244 [Gemmatales bacterium]|nr:MAG: hypothetical protein KatS3mg105_2244 [Gemmatales bacterium]
MDKLSICVIVRNQQRQLRALVKRLLAAPIPAEFELVVADNSSTDASRQILTDLTRDHPRLRPVFHVGQPNRAAALACAFEELSGDVVLLLDSTIDLHPGDYEALLEPMRDGCTDVVLGSRELAGFSRRVLRFCPTMRRRILTLLANLLYDVRLSEWDSGCLVARTDILRSIPLTDARFVGLELIAKLAQWDLRLYEVPICLQGEHAHDIRFSWKNLFRCLWLLTKNRVGARPFTTHEGFYILQSCRKARGLNRWMIQQMKPFLGRRVLEAGCGIGNLSELLLDRDRLICADNDTFYVERIARRFAHLDHVTVRELDLARMDQCRELDRAGIDTIICINVLEHIEDDRKVLRDFFRVLEAGGHAILLVPAHPQLYTGVDRTLGHFRRYAPGELENKMREAGFEIVHSQGFNRLGTLGWYVSGKWLRQTTLSPGQMKTYERLLPLAKLIEKIPVWPQLSVIAVGRKPAAAARRAA